MKKKILLVDESLTVQKVVALTLDKSRFSLSFARNKAEAKKWISEVEPDLIFVSEQAGDIQSGNFPKEVEAWSGRTRKAPPCILITGQDIKEAKHYKAVMKKPFTPQTLIQLVDSQLGSAPGAEVKRAELSAEEDGRLERIFNDAFPDEARLVRETFEQDEFAEGESTVLQFPLASEERPAPIAKPVAAPTPSRPSTNPSVADLWGPSHTPSSQTQNREEPKVLGPDDSMAYKANLETQVKASLQNQNLEGVVQGVLEKILPPIVEKVVSERLDQMLKEQETLA